MLRNPFAKELNGAIDPFAAAVLRMPDHVKGAQLHLIESSRETKLVVGQDAFLFLLLE